MSLMQWTVPLAACFLHLATSAQVDRNWAACPTPLEFRCSADPTCSSVPCSSRATNVPRQPPSLQEQLRKQEKKRTTCEPGSAGKGGQFDPATQECVFGLIMRRKTTGSAAASQPGLIQLRPSPTAECAKGPLGEGGQYRVFSQTCNEGRIADVFPEKK